MRLRPFQDVLRMIKAFAANSDDLVIWPYGGKRCCRPLGDFKDNRRDSRRYPYLAERFPFPTSRFGSRIAGSDREDFIATLNFEANGFPFASHNVPGDAVNHSVKARHWIAAALHHLVARLN